jgi:hypothetical protein
LGGKDRHAISCLPKGADVLALKAFFISGRDAHGRRRQMRRAKLLQIRTEIRLEKCEKVPGGGGSATL